MIIVSFRIIFDSIKTINIYLQFSISFNFYSTNFKEIGYYLKFNNNLYNNNFNCFITYDNKYIFAKNKNIYFIENDF